VESEPDTRDGADFDARGFGCDLEAIGTRRVIRHRDRAFVRPITSGTARDGARESSADDINSL
jgi:hypothetical protein